MPVHIKLGQCLQDPADVIDTEKCFLLCDREMTVISALIPFNFWHLAHSCWVMVALVSYYSHRGGDSHSDTVADPFGRCFAPTLNEGI